MTGLVPGKDKILEIAVIVTDVDLDPLHDEGFVRVIHFPEEVMTTMDPWCIQHHGKVHKQLNFNEELIDKKSGLTKRVLESTNTTKSVEKELLEYIQKYVPIKETGYLAGNSVHYDKEFMRIEFPNVLSWLHYRLIGITFVNIAFAK
jgi:oligoribonuclease